MKVREAIAQVLATDGQITTAYAVLGGGNMYAVHDLVKQHGVRFVPACREDGAVLMAHGHAQCTGQLGLASVTHGAGLTNSMTALLEASRANTPLIVLTGEDPVTMPMNERQITQHVDQPSVVAPTGAAYQVVHSPQTAVADVRRAIDQALSGRRPVVLALPADIQEMEAADEPAATHNRQRQAVGPDPDAVDVALGAILSSRRPLILAGRGAVLSDARSALEELARILGAPVATTLLAKGYCAGATQVGVFGTLSTAAGGQVIAEADCIIACGASLNPWTTSNGSLLDGKTVIQIDDDPGRLGQNAGVRFSVLGDVARTVTQFVESLSGIGHEGVNWSRTVAETLEGHSIAHEFADASGDETIDPRTFFLQFDSMLPDRNLVTDGGRFVVSPLQCLTVQDPRRFVVAMSFMATGSGIGTAIGVACARPESPTVLVVGDGGLMMGLAELTTAVQENLDLVVVVVDDSCYSSEYHRFKQKGMDPTLAMLHHPDLTSAATGLGFDAIAVRNLRDLSGLAEFVKGRTRPVLVDVRVDPAQSLGFFDG